MMNQRRQALAWMAAATASAALPAHAQSGGAWPGRPVRWVVPFPPGGAMDVIARTLSERAARALGQPFVVENRPGAGGNIGAEVVAKSPADGYTIMITSIGMATNRALYARLAYDPVKDFAPVSLLAVVPNVLVVRADNPSRSVRDLLAMARKNPGKYTYASAGNGTSIHLAGEVFASEAGIDILHVPYKGSGPAIADLLGGQVDMMFDSVSSAGPHIQAGKLRALGVTTSKRSAALPDVPTIAEAGLPGYEVAPWYAVFAPAGTPPAIVARLQTTLAEAMQQPDIQSRFAAIGADSIGSSPAQMARHLQDELTRWDKVIKDRKIHID